MDRDKILRCAECGEIIGRDEDYIAIAEIDPIDHNLVVYSYYHIECLPEPQRVRIKEMWNEID